MKQIYSRAGEEDWNFGHQLQTLSFPDGRWDLGSCQVSQVENWCPIKGKFPSPCSFSGYSTFLCNPHTDPAILNLNFCLIRLCKFCKEIFFLTPPPSLHQKRGRLQWNIWTVGRVKHWSKLKSIPSSALYVKLSWVESNNTAGQSSRSGDTKSVQMISGLWASGQSVDVELVVINNL